MAELIRVRKQGFAIDNEETLMGIACVGAPVSDRNGQIVAALSISGPVEKILGKLYPQLVKDVVRAAGEISRNLGCSIE